MSRIFSVLSRSAFGLVRLLPSAGFGMKWQTHKQPIPRWRGGADFRVVCDCQIHRRKRVVLKRVFRVCAAFISVAFATIEYPVVIEAMNLSPSTRPIASAKVPSASATVMPMFTTQRVRDQFLNPGPQLLTLEFAKEEFFRTHVPYGSIIYREAVRNQLAPELVAAVVETESDFRKTLVSGKKAQGLMQIVPETAELLGVTDPFDPAQNIAAGTRYLRYLMNRFPHDPSLALAAYNAGETRVARDGIPQYDETLSYIAKVNRRTTLLEQRVRKSWAAASRMRVAF